MSARADQPGRRHRQAARGRRGQGQQDPGQERPDGECRPARAGAPSPADGSGATRDRDGPTGGALRRRGRAEPHGVRVPVRRADLLRVVLLVSDGPRGHPQLPAEQLRRPGRRGSGSTTSARCSRTRRSASAWRNTAAVHRAGPASSASPSRSSLAVVLNELRHAKAYLRFVVYLPVMLPPAVARPAVQVVLRPGRRPVQPDRSASSHLPAAELARLHQHGARLPGDRRPPG